ncbi:unnamed protein product (macronuclear) [Paramecium tetraurelia]|uniref:Uncharacterized protein n=1 Tax=Paramecium tetraurelia TaxID=5888 RepID=A0EHQ5_PARTE|nr:uncharacterized protein GSPATT00027172001 [Paramecium tetraurelia]CAK94846.1 unnamed protein product [Paramecium tetraurelia]|eukprot:XP_001462219.1 hypothetical protein (macronuclear) [Paramecium tetraurelia strain d4-2]
MNQQSLPQLQRFKQIAQTPDENSKRADEVTRLKQQVAQLQKQIEFVQQNKSFVMKIQNQQCTLCLRYKTQIEQLLKQEKQIKKQYEFKIEELSQGQNQSISKQKPSQTSQTDKVPTLDKEIQVELLIESQPQQNQIDNLKQSPLVKQYEEIIIDFHKDYQNKVYQVLQYKELYEKQKQQYEQFKSQHTNCNEKIHKLQIEVSLLKDTSNQYKLPDNIMNLKRSIDCTIEQNKMNQIVMKTQEGDSSIKIQRLISMSVQDAQNAKSCLQIHSLLCLVFIVFAKDVIAISVKDAKKMLLLLEI